MKKFVLLSLFVLFLGAFAAAQCGSNCLFYGGDHDSSNPDANGLANETDNIVAGDPYGAATFQNFTNSETWLVQSLFSNNLSGLNPTTAYWEIRSGVSEGNGGTVVASGTGATTNVATGRSDFGFLEYRNEVEGLNLTLNPGTYWMAVVPNDPSSESRSFAGNSFGLNAVGTQTSDLQYWDTGFFGASFTNADSEGVFSIFSQGVTGTVVPEPSSMIMLGSGLLVAAGAVRRRFM